MDLNLFQFDKELTWACFFMNADKTLYGRYGTRADHKDPAKYVSVDGLKKALQGALELHAAYPGNKASLAGKTGEKAPWPVPERIPELQGKPNVKPADGTRGGCVHCHQASDAETWSLRAARKPVSDAMLWPFPLPTALGLGLDPAERATVTDVEPGSPAEKGGFKTGDRVLSLDGQPLLSVADVQWVLHDAKEPSTLKGEVERDGRKLPVSLALAAGWRRKTEFSWRVIVWGMRHRLLGLEPLEKTPEGLRVKKQPPDWVKQKNPDGAKFMPGDVIVDVDGQRGLLREDDLLAYLMKKPPGSAADVTVTRAGKQEKLTIKIP
jgi:serine protease Do